MAGSHQVNILFHAKLVSTDLLPRDQHPRTPNLCDGGVLLRTDSEAKNAKNQPTTICCVCVRALSTDSNVSCMIFVYIYIKYQ